MKSPSYRKPSPAIRQPSGSRDYNAPLGPRPPEFASRRYGGHKVSHSRATTDSLYRLTSTSILDPSTFNAARASYAAPTSEPFPGLAARRLISTSVAHHFFDHHEHKTYSSESGQSSPQQFYDALQERPLTGEPFDNKDVLPFNSLPGLPAPGTDAPRRLARDGDFPLAASGHTSNRRSPVRLEKASNFSATAALRAAQLSAKPTTAVPVAVSLPAPTRTSNSVPRTTSALLHQPRDQSPLRAQIPRKAVLAKAGVLEASNRSTVTARDEAHSRTEALRQARSARLQNNKPLKDMIAPSTSIPLRPQPQPLRASHSHLQMQLNGSPIDIALEKHTAPVLKPSPSRLLTPSAASSHRQSNASFHSGSLGARTISPTDARRLKRLSVVDLDPTLNTHRRSPTPELTFGQRAGRSSPRLSIPKLSTTLSSHGATLDSHRRASVGRSLSSQSSFNSLRPVSTDFQAQQVLNSNVGKLPAAKPRMSHSPNEMVPPVPAIPKVYESPQEIDKPFFSHLKLDSPELPRKASAVPLPITRRPIMETPDLKATITTSQESRQRRGLTLGHAGSEPSTATQLRSKPMAQPSRLPPLNLLPLSEPIEAKIAALDDRPAERQNGARTPSRNGNSTLTPSTPLTASKAVFTARDMHFESGQKATAKRRSGSSSQYDIASIFRTAKSSPQNTLAQSSLSDAPNQSPKASHTEPRLSKLTTLRNRALSKSTDSSNAVQALSLSDVQNPPLGTGLRRKLSLGWRRSSSKALHYSQPADLIQSPSQLSPDKSSSPQVSAFESMTGRAVSAMKPERSLQPSVMSQTQTQAEVATKVEALATLRPTPKSMRSSSSLLLANQRVPTTRSPSADPNKAVHQNHDADGEMRKLAVKRKDFEAAVKDLDFQGKRAIAMAPITASLACRKAKLNIYERGEIIDYNHIYFCGTETVQKLHADLTNQSINFGFDDERGDYNIVYGDHLAYRYEVLDALGKGSFGQVVRCIDYKTGKLVAIKIIRNKKRFHQQALVEVNILKKLREWDPDEKHSMVNFTQSFYFRGHLCISTELLGMNLYEFIKTHDFKGFSLKLIRRFAQQMLSSLSLLHSRNVIHCDLKPENVLLSHPYRSEIKVIDFGSSCLDTEKVYTYIQSRFYRSPEVILGMDYGMPIDMWSLGCILAELLIGYPIFPGENEQEQLSCIMEVFGPPEKHLIEQSTRKKLFFDSVGKPRVTVSTKGKRRRPSSKTLQQALKCDDEVFVDFIARCLRWDPKRRMQPDEGLAHDFITGERKTVRARAPAATTSGRLSPTKRTNNGQTPIRAPMAAPPGPVLPLSLVTGKTGTVSSSREREALTNPSPARPNAALRRLSTMNGSQPSLASKRSSTGGAIGSALPRVTPRTISGRNDLASAAAIASLVR